MPSRQDNHTGELMKKTLTEKQIKATNGGEGKQSFKYAW
jgi:hypothetical protein